MPFGSGFGFMVSSASTASSAAAFLARWSSDGQGMVMDFADDQSVKIVDTSTPANNKDSSGIVSSAGALVGPGASLTYTSPSSKLCRQESGLFLRQAHNLCLQSENWTTTWNPNVPGGTGSVVTVTANYAANPIDGAMTAARLQFALNGGTSTSDISKIYQSILEVSGAKYSGYIWARSTDGTSSYNMHILSPAGATAVTVTGTWTKIAFSSVASIGSASNFGFQLRGGQTPTHADSVDIIVHRAHKYREPANADYVRTTSAAVYAPPYKWNPSGVCQGVLIEPSATNLVTYSRKASQWSSSTIGTRADTGTGIDGIANSCGKLTLTAANQYASWPVNASGTNQPITVTAYIRQTAGAGTTYFCASYSGHTATGSESTSGSSELITNGDFSTLDMTGWTNVGSPTLDASSGSCVATIDSSNYFYQSFSTTVGTTYLVSVNISAISGASINFGSNANAIRYNTTGIKTFLIHAISSTTALFVRGAGGSVTATIDDISVKAVSSGGVSIAISPTSTFQRFESTRTLSEASSIANPFLICTDASAVFEVDYVQLEATAYSTSPIETFASSLSRNADAETQATSTFPWSATANTIYVEGKTPASSSKSVILQYDGGSSAARIRIERDASNNINAIITVSSVDQVTLNLGTVANSTSFKAAFAVKAGDYAGCLNGGTVQTSSYASIPTVTTKRTGASFAGEQWRGYVAKEAQFPSRLSNATLQSMTT